MISNLVTVSALLL